MNIDSIIERIRGLRALSASSNVHEAAAAAAAADRLIQQYRLEEAQLEIEEGPGDVVKSDDPLVSWGSKATWRRLLLGGICEHYDVAYCYYQKPPGNVAYAWGRASDIVLTREMYAFVESEIDHLAKLVRGRGRRAANAFRIGAACGVLDQLRDAKAETLKDAAQSTAIVLADRSEQSDAAMRASVGQMRSVPMGSRPGDARAFAEGHAAGQSLDLSAGKRLQAGDN